MLKRVTFGNYAGVNIPGTIPMELDVNKDGFVTHAERASWLTAQVESGGKFGNVMNYDGTGMTIGIHQAICVFPRDLDSTGTAWELLADIRMACKATNCSDWYVLENALRLNGFELGLDGVLRENGAKAKGTRVRYLLTGAENGVMPESGSDRQRAEMFAELFAKLMRNPDTFAAQVDFGIKHFAKWAKRPMRFCKKMDPEVTIGQFAYGVSDDFIAIKAEQIPVELDLAMSMFWSHSVNAPGFALEVFCKAADSIDNSTKLANVLIKKLATAKYGRWDDDIPNGRYQRTRTNAMKIWPKELFEGPNAIMPKDFKD